MNKKKCKLDYDPEEVRKALQKLLIDENIIASQKCYMYSQYKTYKELYYKLQKDYKDLEIENIKLYDQLSNKNIIQDNKENYQNVCTDFDDSINDTQDIKNKLDEYSTKLKDYSEDENQTLLDKITSLRTSLKDKENKIVELENTVIKLQILSRTNNIKQDSDENSDEIINLKTRVEYSKLEKERLIVNSNNKIMEIKIKYEEFMKKYEKINDNFNNSLLNIEELKNVIKENEIKKIDQITGLQDKIKIISSEIDNLYDRINILSKDHQDIKNQTYLIINHNKETFTKLNMYKLFENKKNNATGEDFYDEEISNLLEVCDSLTEENKKTSLIIKQLEQKIFELERKNTNLEQEKDFISINSNSSNLLRYVEDLAQQKKIISTHITEIKTLTDEKNKLIRLNVERIKLIDKYKDELKNKNIEMLCLERKNEDIEKTLKEFEKDVQERLSRKVVNENDKNILICNLCDSNTKNVAITSCMHTFCEGCIQMRIKLRDRKCPTCGYSFNVNDVKRMYL